MTKRSQRRAMRRDKNQLGCMWAFMSILDFRQGRYTRRLISDKRRGSSHTVDAEHSVNKFEVLADLDENLQGTLDDKDSTRLINNTGKPSVKSLIEEEMVDEHGLEIKAKDPKLASKQSDSGNEDRRRKNWKRCRKSSRESYDMDVDYLKPPELQESQCPLGHDAGLDPINTHNGSLTTNKICGEICQESMNNGKNDKNAEVQMQSNMKNSALKEELCEAIKEFINRQLNSGKHITDQGRIHFSKEIVNALQIPNLDEESFLKLLRDQDSILFRYTQSFQDAHSGRDGLSESFAESDLTEEKHEKSKESKELVNHKSYKFFRRNAKPHKTSNDSENPQTANRIVILKPGPADMKSSGSVDSFPPQSPNILDKRQTEKASSHFLFTEIRRRLKNVMGKEHRGVSPDGVKKRLPDVVKANVGENHGMKSPGKEHFYIEKLPVGSKREEKISKHRDAEVSQELETVNDSKRRASNIYVEAKKHLAEMLSTPDEVTDSSSRQFGKSLGRILALSEYNSPVVSPRMSRDTGFVAAQMRLSSLGKAQLVDESEVKQIEETNDSHQGPSIQSRESKSGSPIRCDDKIPTLDTNPIIAQEPLSSEDLEETSDPTDADLSHKDETEVKQTVDVVADGECITEDTSIGIVSSTSIECGPKDHWAQNFDECDRSVHQKKEPHFSDEQPSSPLGSPSSSSIMRKIVNLEILADISERRSPVSVLEPLFTEDDISPASARTATQSELSIRPLKINFEDETASTPKLGICAKPSMEDKESVLEYVKSVLQASGLDWNKFYWRSEPSDQLIEPSLFDEIDFFHGNLHYDRKLVFDCINEVLLEFCERYVGCSPWVSFVKPGIKPVSAMTSIINEVWEGVNWHLLPISPPHNLEQIIRKDMAKSGMWMDLRLDAETIGFEMGDSIFDELIEETMDNCVNES